MFSKLRNLSKAVPICTRGFKTSVISKSEGHHEDLSKYYRSFPPPDKYNVRMAEFLGMLFWSWILYHVFTEPGHFMGVSTMPDIDKWTNAELGIPPDDED